MIKKDHTINLRVRSKDLKRIKEAGLKYSDIWDFGFEHFLCFEREFLKELDEKYYKMYIRVHTKLENFDDLSKSSYLKLSDLMDWYLKQDRSIEEPSQLDIDTLKLQMKKREIYGVTIDKVFEFFKENKPKPPPRKKMTQETRRKISAGVMKYNQQMNGGE